MSKREILAGATDQTIDIFVNNSSSTTGAGLTGLVFNSAGLTCYYRKGATGSATALTLATQTVTGAHSDGGFVEIDSTNMPGTYRLDLSDTMVAAAGMLTIYLHGATNMAPIIAELEIVSVNKFDSVRMGLTALPNAAADAAGGLPISDAGGLDLDTLLGRLDAAVTTRLAPTTAGRTLDITAGGCAGVDWANVEAPTTVVGLTGTTIASTQNITNVTGTVASVTAIAANGITASSFSAGAIDATAIATNAIDADALAADALAEINAEVVDALATDTYAEPGQGTPAATATLAAKINYLYKAWRNKKTQTSTQFSLYADDTTTVDQKATTSDDGSTTTVGEIATGP